MARLSPAAIRRKTLLRTPLFLLFIVLDSQATRVTCIQQIPKAAEHYERGLALFAQEKYPEASSEFTKAIEINPEFGDAYFHLGLSSLAEGRAQEAIRAFMRLSQLEPQNIEPILAASEIYFKLDDFQNAWVLATRAQRIEPRNSKVYVDLGLIQLKQSHYSEAIQPLSRALELEPAMIQARLLLASAYEGTGDLERAVENVREGVQRSPQSPELLTRLGNLLLNQGHILQAEGIFQRVLELQGNYLPARIGLARTHRRQGLYSKAISELNQILIFAPQASEALFERALAAYEQGDLLAARKDFEAFAHAEPGRAEGYLYLGLVDMNRQDYEAAALHFSRAFAINPRMSEASCHLGEAYFRLSRLDRAEDALRKCLSLSHSNEKARQLLDQIQKQRSP